MGVYIADRALDIIEKLCSPQMTVTKDGKLVIYSDGIKSMYICDSTNAEKDYKLTLPLKNVHPDDIKELSFTVSDQKKIIYIFSKRSDETSFTIHIITMDGELKHEVKVPTTTDWLFSINVIFNHVNKTIVVTLFNNNDHSSTSDYKKKVITFPEILLFTFSKTGELLYEFKIPCWTHHQLTSHPSGRIGLVDKCKLIICFKYKFVILYYTSGYVVYGPKTQTCSSCQFYLLVSTCNKHVNLRKLQKVR